MSLHVQIGAAPTEVMVTTASQVQGDLLAIRSSVTDEMLHRRLREATEEAEKAEAEVAIQEAKGKRRKADLYRTRARARREEAQRFAEEIDRRGAASTAPVASTASDAHVSTPEAQPGDLAAQLAKLGSLHACGVLTDEEFAAAKARLLS